MSTLLGRHLLVELHDCDSALLDDEQFLRSQCAAAAGRMGATVVKEHSHRFTPIGVSVVIILAESHLSLHTWPEYGLAAVDIFVCGPGADPHVAKQRLSRSLKAGRVVELEIRRGELADYGPRPKRRMKPIGARPT